MTDIHEILELIERAQREGWAKFHLTNYQLTNLLPEISKLVNLTTLDLSQNELMSVPPELSKLPVLTTLILSENQLESLPTGIAALSNLKTLDLNRNQLATLPPEITKLVNLTSLYLKYNRFTGVPPQIPKLINLTTLDLRGNQLKRVPPRIGNLTKLTNLNLTDNKLTSLPSEIGCLTNLTVLSLNDNELTSLPVEIGCLTNLTHLSLNDNELTSLPAEIGNLINLTTLDLRRNRLVTLPQEIANLTKLTSLVIGENQLNSLPPHLAKLVSLTKLNLGNNHLTSLPPEVAQLTALRTFTVCNNQLASLPPEIAQLTNLTSLNLIGNQLAISPETLSNPRNLKAIFAAAAGLASGERLNEAKMLVLGDAKVGKSSVVQRLVRGTFDPWKQTTLGVDINDEMKVIQTKLIDEGEPVRLNIWDFGGQEIQHSTHEFFLTTRSLYLLVVDARKGDQIGNIEYWLKLIESFGGDSPIIVVINQIDQLKGQRPLNLDRKALQQKYNIRDFVETSCESGVGIQQLKTTITREVEQLKHVRDVWPREWIAIKRRLKDMQDDYIPVEKYLEICREEKLADEDLQQSLLDILHALGTVVRFPGDTQVLNPRWVTQGVYGLLTSDKLVEDQGQFDLQDVGRILAGVPDANEHYPAHTHERLIKVMQHFELCFEFTDRSGHYLIPRHLHDNEPETSWDDSGALKFQYHYETLPDSVISRFIVRMNQFIDEHHYWKNGVFLQSGENRARIKADMVDRRIFISVTGKEQTRRAFLAVIRSAFDEINGNFKIEIEQKIPVPGFPHVLVSYKDLLAYEEMNEAEIVIPELRKRFSVRELLDGVEDLSTRVARRDRDVNVGASLQRSPVALQSKLQPRILRIVVASPGDVQPERDLLPAVLEEVNRSAADHGLHLVLTRWETDTHPGFHADGPQGLIDPILKITDCDLLIGIFWKRFGTPTSDGTTGTEHEFNLAHAAWEEKGSPQIFVYFNEKASNPKSTSEIEQWGRVVAFREKFPKEGLWWPYRGKVQFEKLVRNHLMNYIRTLA